jgi:hypothetical protein
MSYELILQMGAMGEPEPVGALDKAIEIAARFAGRPS